MPNRKKPRGKSQAVKTPATKRPVARARPPSVGAESRARAKLKDNVAQLAPSTPPMSTSSVRLETFEMASEALQSLIHSNLAALRTRMKKAKDNAQDDRTTIGKAEEDFTTALNRLEAGYRELLRGK